MIGDIFITVIVLVFILDLLIITVYCRVMFLVDKRRKEKMKEVSFDQSKSGQTTRLKKSIIKSTIKRITIFLLDHFLYGLMRYSIIIVGKIPSGHIRNWLYRFVFYAKITKRTVIYGGSEIRSPWNLYADNCVISNNCILDCRNEIHLGENVVFGVGVHVWTEQHDIDSPTFQVTPENRGAVIIGNRAWICSDSTILPGIHIGEGAVLAARACATKSLEAYSVYAGIPAKKIKERNQGLIYELSGKTHWHFY